MLKIEGSYGEAIVYNDTVEDTARQQIALLMNQKDVEDSLQESCQMFCWQVIGYTAN